MVYLMIIVVIATAGIARLWLMQRRQQARMFSVAEFRDGLEKIAAPSPRPSSDRPQTPPRPVRPRLSTHPRGALDPERRAAAKQRLEARRAAREHLAR